MLATAKKQPTQPAAAISAADAKRGQKSNYVPLKIRFKAWWEGVSVETLLKRQRRTKQRKASTEIEIDQPVEESLENKTDIELLMTIRERVWGKDFIVPGGQDYVSEFLKPAKLKPGVVALDISAGLGGSNRAIAVDLDALVEGLDTNEAVAKMGAARAAQLALDKQAPISHFLPHNPFLRVDRYDCVYGHEAFYRILDKLNLFNEIWKSMKEGGHLIFTDLVYAGRDVKITDEIRNWVNAEPEAPDPWTPEEYREKFEKLGFEFVSFEDDTPRYQQLIKDGWANFTDTLDEQGIDRRFVDIMMHEANIWQCRMQAIKSGNLRFLRIHAQRPKATLR